MYLVTGMWGEIEDDVIGLECFLQMVSKGIPFSWKLFQSGGV